MPSLIRPSALLVLAVMVPTAGAAQNLSVSKIDVRTPTRAIRIPSRLPQLEPARTHADNRMTTNRQPVPRPQRRVMGWAIAIGIGAGVSAAGIAASKYGENEGGKFCARCFTEWSAISIPIGAGVGAAVGYLIDRSHR